MKIKQVGFLVEEKMWLTFVEHCEKRKISPEEVLRRYIKYQVTGEM